MDASTNPTENSFFSPDSHTFFYSWEIKKHLELRPFLEIPLQFDHKGCFEEALQILNLFVDHRNYAEHTEKAPRWRSVCLRGLDGATEKTLYHADYGVRESPNYQLTEAARLCPKTMNFLSSITDIDRCERIRFMLLEPGAKIHVHTDAPHERSVVAFNIALNMPEGCDFFINTRPDGSHSPWTEKIPFKDGSGFLINVAKYHYVENRSSVPRIHIILHGPLKMTENRLLQWARQRNHVRDEKQLISRLTLNFAQEGSAHKSDIISEWVRFACETEEINRHVRVVILSPSGYDAALTEENTHHLTAASLYPIAADVINENSLDAYLAAVPANDDRMIVVLGAGTYIPRFYEFFYEVFCLLGRIKEKNIPIAGHILNLPDKHPTLHEQFFILNTPLWRQAGSPLFEDLYNSYPLHFSGFTPDKENIHDNYTPKALYPAARAQGIDGSGGFASRVLSQFLERNWNIENIPAPLRAQKHYSYFKKENSKELRDIRNHVREKISTEGAQVYCFNNEPLHTTSIDGFEPTALLSVASGFKPASLAFKYGGETKPLSCFFYDINANALKYQRALATSKDRKTVLKTIWSFDTSKELKSTAADYLELVLKHSFKNNEAAFLKTLQNLASATYRNTNFVTQPEEVLADIPSAEQSLFWHSNAWSNNLVYFLMSKSSIENKYLELIESIKGKLKTKAWRHAYHREVLFGARLEDIQAVMTDGVMQGQLNPALYKEI